MKIAVSVSGGDLDAQVDPRFGRASGFLLIDPETMDYEVVENKQNVNAPQGAGIQAAATIARAGASVLLTGHCGPKAFQTLQAAGVKVIVGVEGSVRDALEAFRVGRLQTAGGPDVEGHWS
ncbi:MAG: dinitrogenase iron-molybdenum cofactor biosynthesis protein [Deltaproteobacteria bacterium]|nr:dinitrogenase iron-molybdenum cofactor biosynthesis protein [Deltaproteobacteria bacterium]